MIHFSYLSASQKTLKVYKYVEEENGEICWSLLLSCMNSALCGVTLGQMIITAVSPAIILCELSRVKSLQVKRIIFQLSAINAYPNI